jgi:hypothetical protein
MVGADSSHQPASHERASRDQRGEGRERRVKKNLGIVVNIVIGIIIVIFAISGGPEVSGMVHTRST